MKMHMHYKMGILHTALIISERVLFAPQTVLLNPSGLRSMVALKVTASMALELYISVEISNNYLSGVKSFDTAMGMTQRNSRADMEREFCAFLGVSFNGPPFIT